MIHIKTIEPSDDEKTAVTLKTILETHNNSEYMKGMLIRRNVG